MSTPPAPLSGLPTLAQVSDIENRILPRTLSPAEQTRAAVLLQDASAQIRRYCRKTFQSITEDIQVFRANGSAIKLPGRPIVSVDNVVAISGNEYCPDLPVTWWTFDEIDEISFAEASASGVINLPEAWYEFGAYPGTFRVTYTHGYPVVPDEVVMVCATAVISVLLAPTMAAGVIGETIGSYSYRLERTGGGLAVALSEADLAALNDFRDKTATIKLEV